MNIENKDKIIEGMKNTIKSQSALIHRYEEAFHDIVECSDIPTAVEEIAKNAINK